MSGATMRALAFFNAADSAIPKLSCGQAVLAGLSLRVGIDEETAIRCGRGFGGGIGHQGNVCGALCGAVIALGLGQEGGESERHDRAATQAAVRELFRQFRALYGETECRLLIGIDPSTPEGEDEIHARGIHRTHCTRFVESAVTIVEDLLNEAEQRRKHR